MSTSQLEDTFAYWWELLAPDAPEPEREFRFDRTRRFRSDFAWPHSKVLVEIEGGMHNNGRHNRAGGYARDCVKYNLAISQGWKVFRYTGDMLRNDPDSVIRQVLAAVWRVRA